MIISRSPLRISLAGGATDLPSYYTQFGGFCVSAAIDQYVYVSIHETPIDEIVLRYSQIERVKSVDEIHHPIIREALKLTGITQTNIEITSMADQAAGTGLGSSGSFTTALLKALFKFKKHFISPEKLAELACHIELDILKEPIGKQDQYIAATGGVTHFEFHKDGKIDIQPVNISKDILHKLEHNLIMVNTGYTRSASLVLQDQNDRTKKSDNDMINNLHYVKELGYKILKVLENGELNQFGILMNEHWQNKKKRSPMMTNSNIDFWYQLGQYYGAAGGKVIGGGGGGFLLFYTEDRQRLLKGLNKAGLKEVNFKFDFEGTKIL